MPPRPELSRWKYPAPVQPTPVIPSPPGWVDYTPAITATVTNPTLGSGHTQGIYTRIGGVVMGKLNIVWSGGTAGEGIYEITLPLTYNSLDGIGEGPAELGAKEVMGHGFMGAQWFTGGWGFSASRAAITAVATRTSDNRVSLWHSFNSALVTHNDPFDSASFGDDDCIIALDFLYRV